MRAAGPSAGPRGMGGCRVVGLQVAAHGSDVVEPGPVADLVEVRAGGVVRGDVESAQRVGADALVVQLLEEVIRPEAGQAAGDAVAAWPREQWFTDAPIDAATHGARR